MSDQLQLDTITPRAPRAERRSGTTMPERDALHLSDYLKVLVRRRWTALAAFLAVMIAVVIYTFTATPIYRARVRLERLHEHATGSVAAAAAGELRQELKRPLLGAEVRQPQPRVGVDDRGQLDEIGRAHV